MDFKPSPQVEELLGRVRAFQEEHVYPVEADVMRALDDERLAVAAAFGHRLPNLIEEMKLIGTVESSVEDTQDFMAAIAGGEANKRIKGPDSLQHRYYREDFGHGLLPFLELAAIAGVATPVARSLFTLAQVSIFYIQIMYGVILLVALTLNAAGERARRRRMAEELG